MRNTFENLDSLFASKVVGNAIGHSDLCVEKVVFSYFFLATKILKTQSKADLLNLVARNHLLFDIFKLRKLLQGYTQQLSSLKSVALNHLINIQRDIYV